MNDVFKNDLYVNMNDSTNELFLATDHLLNELKLWNLRFKDASYLSDQEKLYVQDLYELVNVKTFNLRLEIEEFILNIKLAERKSLSNEFFIERKRKLYLKYRLCISFYSSLMTCLNWQSPAIKASLNSRIGIERSLVKADWNDYKRDRSEETFYCEKIIGENIIRTPSANPDSVLNVFNSGMGAYTVILYYLICEGIIKNKIFASSHIYVENRILLKKFFGDKAEFFEYNDADLIIKNIIANKPSVVFIEPVSNTSLLRLFDVKRIIKEILARVKDEIFIIVDVTCSLGFENLLDDIALPENIKVILHGSLLKSPQLGIERINAGFIQAFRLGENGSKILDYRTMSGTNIQDFASNLIPFTSRELMQKRMKIIERNATELAMLMEKIDPKNEIIEQVIYPGIKSHKDYKISKEIGFSGFFFNVKLKNEINHDKYFEIFTKEVVRISENYNCEIVHGASFGFNNTSIYYSVGWDEPENHYIRISTGIETFYELEKIKKIFIEAYHSFKNILLKSHNLKINS